MMRSPLLRSLLLMCFALSILLPTYSSLFIMPKLVDQLMSNVENDALRTARHLSEQLLNKSERISRESITDNFISELSKSITDFEIADIKIFSANGEVIYSTKRLDIGKLNKNAYFWEKVAKGMTYSKFVPKKGKSAEGVTLTRDVAEVYIPLMTGNSFQGAFEIYYDVTDSKQSLNQLLFRSSVLFYFIAFIVLSFSVIALWKASSAIILRNRAEIELQEFNHSLERRIVEQTHEIIVTQRISIEALAGLAEYYDSNTGEHLVRIRHYTMLLLEKLINNSAYTVYLSERPGYLADLQLASLLHDIGKTAISKDILTKPSKLTPEEFEHVKLHTVIAGDVLFKANKLFIESFGKDSYLALARDIATHHHERWDGRGYPHGLSGEKIPLSARIIALVDVYDALRSKRPYKKAWCHEDAVAEIIRERGKQFDPGIVDLFMELSEEFEKASSSRA